MPFNHYFVVASSMLTVVAPHLWQDLFGTLSPEDIEMAAQGSYAYWVAKHSSKPPTEEEKVKMAMREARRHIYGVKYPDAVKNIKETCKYRRVSFIAT